MPLTPPQLRHEIYFIYGIKIYQFVTLENQFFVHVMFWGRPKTYLFLLVIHFVISAAALSVGGGEIHKICVSSFPIRIPQLVDAYYVTLCPK